MTVWMLLGLDGQVHGLYEGFADLLADLGIGNYSVLAIIDDGGSEIVLVSGGELMLACEQCVVRYNDTPDDNTFTAMWTRGRDVTVMDWTTPSAPVAVTEHTVRVSTENQADRALNTLGFQRIETWRPTESHECFIVRVIFIGHR